jgi:hypothetical protein
MLSVRVTHEAEARPRWSALVPGRSVNHVFVVAEAASVLVADGWGVHPAAVRLHAFDIATGAERSAFRSGTSIRCLQRMDGSNEILAASDTRLHRLALPSLVEQQRWTTRIPRFADSMAVMGGRVLLANWFSAGIAVVDLDSETVRRRPSAEMVLVVPTAGHPLLVGGRAGGVWQVDVESMTVAKVLDAAPAIDAGWVGGRLWLIEGMRATVATSATGVTSVERGPGGWVLRVASTWIGSASRSSSSFPLPCSGSCATRAGCGYTTTLRC